MPRFILASTSPRRAQLLKQLLPDFQIVPSEAEELENHHLTPRELAQINACRKARSVARSSPDAFVLGADTLVSLSGKLFGKPRDLQHAHRMLMQLQGQTHEVVTGVCLVHWQTGRQRAFAESTDVRFKELSSQQIDRYLALIEPLDKAGAYAIQDHGHSIVSEISGSYSNVVGLPLERLRAELRLWGIATRPPASGQSQLYGRSA
jgi:septum formation protein